MTRNVSVLAMLLGGLLLALPAAAGLPEPAGPSTTIDVGSFGVTDGQAYAEGRDLLYVPLGSHLLLRAPYEFTDQQLPAGSTHQYTITMEVRRGGASLGSDFTVETTEDPGAFLETGALEFPLSEPQVADGLNVRVVASLNRFNGISSILIDQAVKSIAITVLAVPNPFELVAEDLQVGEALDAGLIDYTGTDRMVNATDGKVHFSTTLGTRFIMTAKATQPAVTDASILTFHASVWFTVQLRDGTSYVDSLTLFSASCNDFDTHSCSLEAQAKEVEMVLSLPAGVFVPDGLVILHLSAFYELNWFRIPDGASGSDFQGGSDAGTHYIVSV